MKKINNLLIIVLVVLLITSIIYIYIQNKTDKEQEEIFEELEIISQEEIKEEEEKRDLQELYNMNNDFIGWIEIEDTNISYPVMQTNINRKDYYLHKNFYKEYSSLGTPYIAEFCNVKESDNLIIYGHHISNDRMFGELEKYKKESFYKNHSIIHFDTIYEKADYEIIAVFKTIAETGFKYYKFVDSNSKGEFDTFIKKCKELSFYDTEKTAIYGDRLITLSTCEYSNKNGRLVVVARKITD